ncbi:MAG: hypothetical protein K6B13_02315 [Prevotella sp.]|nr:hypothetical protein [Prevotella sp.]
MTIKTISHWMLMAFMALTIAGLTIACEEQTEEEKENNGNETPETETVQNPTKIQHYDGSSQFISDLETLIDYSCAVYAMRVAYYNIVSNDFKTGQAYVATPEDINANTTSMYDFYDIAATIVDKGDQYEATFQRLEDEGVLERANASRQTRGWLSDTFSFVFGLKKSQEVGRKSVLAVISQSGWQNDDNKLQQLFNAVDPKRRQGYTNARQFWADFSQGKLDAKSNQIFQDLYHDANTDFGTNALDLGFSPTGNMTKTAATLIEKGLSVVIDAAPGGMAASMTMGKDLYNTYEATEDVVKHTAQGTLTKEEAERLIKQWASNLINYNDKILNNMGDGAWDATIDMWDTPGNFLGQEFANMILNDMDNFSEDVFRLSFGDWLDENAIKVKDKDGNPVDVVVVQDEDGKVRVSVRRSEDGSHKVKADKKKKKKVTAADKKGHRKTKDVKAGENEVEVELTKKEEENDEPKDGYLDYSPKTLAEFPAEGGQQRIKLTTNYLYYGVTTSVDDGYWLEAKPVPLSDEFIIIAQPNNSGEDRTGKVIVKATNKNGKVLKWITLTAFQKAAMQGMVIKATPSVLEYGPEGGTQQSTITLEGFEYYGGFLDDSAEGWVSLNVGDDQVFTITVSPNSTGADRTGKVIAYGCNVPKPKYEDITMATIVINQTSDPITNVGNVKEVIIEPDCLIYYDEQWQDMLSDIWQDWSDYNIWSKRAPDRSDVIESVQVGSTIHVKGSYKEDTYYGSKTGSYSFDIVNVSDDFKGSMVNNLSAHIVCEFKDGSDTWTHTYTASNIPMTEYRSTYELELEFNGTVADGITNFSYSEQYNIQREPKDDPRNRMRVKIWMEKPDACRAVRHSPPPLRPVRTQRGAADVTRVLSPL